MAWCDGSRSAAALRLTSDPSADKLGSKRRSSDIISLLVSIYGSKDIFIDEYRGVLADRLLQQLNYNTARSDHLRHPFIFFFTFVILDSALFQGNPERGAAEASLRRVSHALLRGHAEGNPHTRQLDSPPPGAAV